MRHIKMHGPSISNPDEMVERDVPQCDVQAYRAAGYVEGGLPTDFGVKEDTNEDVPAVVETKAKPKGKKVK